MSHKSQTVTFRFVRLATNVHIIMAFTSVMYCGGQLQSYCREGRYLTLRIPQFFNCQSQSFVVAVPGFLEYRAGIKFSFTQSILYIHKKHKSLSVRKFNIFN